MQEKSAFFEEKYASSRLVTSTTDEIHARMSCGKTDREAA